MSSAASIGIVLLFSMGLIYGACVDIRRIHKRKSAQFSAGTLREMALERDLRLRGPLHWAGLFAATAMMPEIWQTDRPAIFDLLFPMLVVGLSCHSLQLAASDSSREVPAKRGVEAALGCAVVLAGLALGLLG